MDNKVKSIRLHRDDLEEILKTVDELNPRRSDRLGAGYVTITEEGSAGIGQSINISIPVTLGEDHHGFFTKNIVDESSW